MRRECGCCGSAEHLEAHAVRVTAWGQVGSVRVVSVEPKAGTGQCNVCTEDVPTHDLIEHVRVMHPDLYGPVETWPDGEPVVIDMTDLDGCDE